MFKPYASQVTIAKVDATLNDVPDEIQGFPTIKLYPAGKKDSPITYSGARTAEDLATFIKENGSHAIEAKPIEGTAEKATEGVKEKVKSAASDAAEAVKSVVADSDEPHDEL
jgi:protein disulfide-isomerase A1